MIIRAYVRQFVGVCKSVFIYGNLIGGYIRHYVPTRSFGFIPGVISANMYSGCPSNLIRGHLNHYVSEGGFGFYYVWRHCFEFISEGAFGNYYVGGVPPNLFT